MKCEELFRLLPGYLDAEMRQELCHELEEHTRECSYCRAHVQTMQETIHLSRDLAVPEIHRTWLLRLRARVLERQFDDESPDGGDGARPPEPLS